MEPSNDEDSSLAASSDESVDVPLLESDIEEPQPLPVKSFYKQTVNKTANAQTIETFSKKTAPVPVPACRNRGRQSKRNVRVPSTLWFKKNVPTSTDYNYDPVQSILIIFSKLFLNDHKSCLVVKFSTSPHICCHYTL